MVPARLELGSLAADARPERVWSATFSSTLCAIPGRSARCHAERRLFSPSNGPLYELAASGMNSYAPASIVRPDSIQGRYP